MTLIVSATLTASPVFAAGEPSKTGQAANQEKKLLNSISKLKEQQVKLELQIKKEIENAKNSAAKKKENNTKQTTNAITLEEKWQAELDKAAAQDKVELDNLNKEIAKWTEMIEKQKAVLTKELADIDSNLVKQLAALDAKLTSAKDDTAKANIAATKTNVQNYASQRKAAINAYLPALQSMWADKQKIWSERKDILTKRQAADMTFRTSMTNIRKAELGDKLASLTVVPSTSDNDIEKTIRAKHQKQIDDIAAKLAKAQADLAALQAKLPK